MYFDFFLLSPRELALLRYCHSYTASSYMDNQVIVVGCNRWNCFAVKFADFLFSILLLDYVLDYVLINYVISQSLIT